MGTMHILSLSVMVTVALCGDRITTGSVVLSSTVKDSLVSRIVSS